MIEANTINCLDCLDGLAQLPTGCAKLIVADPPYFMGLTHNGQHGQFNDLAVAKPFYKQLARELRRREIAVLGINYVLDDLAAGFSQRIAVGDRRLRVAEKDKIEYHRRADKHKRRRDDDVPRAYA